MSSDRPTRDSLSIEEATVSNMWEIAAIVELLEPKGLCTKQDLYDIITEFRRKNPRARIPETSFPEPYLLTETENKIIDDILELLNKHGPTPHQPQNLLERLGRIIEMGQRVAKGTTHEQGGSYWINACQVDTPCMTERLTPLCNDPASRLSSAYRKDTWRRPNWNPPRHVEARSSRRSR